MSRAARTGRTTTPEPRRPRYQLPAPEDPTGSGLFRPNRRLLYGLIVALVVVVVVRGVTGSHTAGPAPFAKSCTMPAFELGTTDLRPGQSVLATLTGPAAGSYVLALDATSVTAQTGTVALTPTDAPLLLTVSTLPGCEQSMDVLVPVRATPGRHVVGMFRSRAGDSGGPLRTITISVS